MTLNEKLDRLVYATGIDRVIFRTNPPRNLRWSPLGVIALMIASYALMTQTQGVALREYLAGALLFYGAIVLAYLLHVLGPRFTATALEPLDERELMVKARAFATSGLVLTFALMMGCFYMTSAAVPWLWHPSSWSDWFHLGFGIQAIGILLPTWIASWLQSPVTDED